MTVSDHSGWNSERRLVELSQRDLFEVDPVISQALLAELKRQQEGLELIPSENYTSRAVLQAMGSVLTNKYSEGYPFKRYYGGNENVDTIEQETIDRAKTLFGVDHANVQPYSGSPANLAVYYALCEPGDSIVGMHLPDGGHLTHGWRVNFSARYYRSFPYTVDPITGRIDYDILWQIAKEHKPRIIWSGGTAYPRFFEFDKFAEIARSVGAYFVADIAHISGLCITGLHPSPVPFADAITMTTHKLLRGPRGGIILCKEQLAKSIDRAVFPALQGGPHENVIAGIGVCLKEAQSDEYIAYCRRVVENAMTLAEALLSHGFALVSGGTDNHLILVDVTSQGLSGKDAEELLGRAGITVNKNMIPNDQRKPFDPSGIRIGTPAVTSRGMGVVEMRQIATWIADVIKNYGDERITQRIKNEVSEMCKLFPLWY